jgi:hypothetical protein
MQIEIDSISELPRTPALYLLYSGKKRTRYVAYVGIANNLKRRIEQHLVNRDSSITTGTSAACLNPDYVTEVSWFSHPKFYDRNTLIAAELVAFDYFQPALRSRGNLPEIPLEMYHRVDFQEEIEKILRQGPTGNLCIQTSHEALKRIDRLEKRIMQLEKKFAKMGSE